MNDLEKLFDEFECVTRFSEGLRSETIKGYRAVFNLFLKVMPEITSVKLLTPEVMLEFFKRIRTRERIVGRDTIKIGVKNSTIKTQWCKLNVFLQWLVKKNHLSENPLIEIRPPRVRYEDFRKLNDSDIKKIYTAITLHSNNLLIRLRDTMMVSLLLFCGIRKGEFISLLVTDIDMDKGTITIRGETSKSKRTRILMLHPTLHKHIGDYLKERRARGLKTEFLIVSNHGDRGLSRDGLIHWTRNLNRKSGVKFHLHMFRHTFAVKLDENNVSAFKIQKLLGHSSILMTQKYVRSMSTESMGGDIAKLSY